MKNKRKRKGLCKGRTRCKMWGRRKRSPLSSAAPICSESAGGALFTLPCMCVKRRAGRKEGQREGGSGGMEGQGWKREEGEDSW